MLQIKANPSKKPASDVTFAAPTTNQKHGIEMLIALNLTSKTVITGPEVGLDTKILVTKTKPHFFFNPIILDPENLQDNGDTRTLCISCTDYLGDERKVTMTDEDGEIRKAIDRLHNGIKRAQRKKKV